MKRIHLLALTCCAAVLLMASLNLILTKSQKVVLPFECTTYTRYDLGEHDDQLLFEIGQDLRFQSLESGYLLLNGKAITAGKVTTLTRTLQLERGVDMGNNTYRYHIKSITRFPTDNTSEVSFEQLMAEFSIDSDNLQLNLVQIDKKSYLVSGPISYLFICARY